MKSLCINRNKSSKRMRGSTAANCKISNTYQKRDSVNLISKISGVSQSKWKKEKFLHPSIEVQTEYSSSDDFTGISSM